jgi:mono/diheme cytochrome c family protein
MSAKKLFVLLAGAMGMALSVGAAENTLHGMELGQHEYQAKCASCHGASGRGDGYFSWLITTSPPNLTTYAERNGGAFPTELAWLTIDGRTLDEDTQRFRGMPVWGQNYRDEALATPSYRTPEVYASERIAALVDYLASIQISEP